MASVTLENVVKTFGKTEVVHGINLEIADKEFVVLVGPSGCGKSTTLRMIAGLEKISSGTIRIADRVVNDVAPKDRDAAMVFQNYALYPHMNVFKNMSFGLELRKIPKAEIKQRVTTAAKLLELDPLLKRKPHELSGGQRQRVAMGRAIVRKPSIFLFDEPLSNLDAKLRTQMRIEIKRLHRRVQATIIFVTHDQVEAMTLAQRIVVMRNGYIEQVGTPLEIFQNPRNIFVAGFIGSPPMNLVPATIAIEDRQPHFRFNSQLSIPIPPKTGCDLGEGMAVIMGLRTEDITLADGGEDQCGGLQPGKVCVQGLVDVVEPLGSETNLHIDIQGIKVVGKCEGRREISAGEAMQLALNLAHLHIFDAKTTRCIY
ncbi:MAG: sn-glycerol-3-phosphate ABC transporter ATP-binding protein UgpC [Desulfobacterales bacterium]